MAETYDFLKSRDQKGFFNHLLLGSEVKELTKRDDFDSSNLSVVLQINGVDVRIDDFNNILNQWGDRIEKQIKQNAGLEDFDRAVEKRAKELIKEKLGNIMENLEDVENQLWKLED